MEPAKGFKVRVCVEFTPVGEYTSCGSFTKNITILKGRPVHGVTLHEFERTLSAYIGTHSQLAENTNPDPSEDTTEEPAF